MHNKYNHTWVILFSHRLYISLFGFTYCALVTVITQNNTYELRVMTNNE